MYKIYTKKDGVLNLYISKLLLIMRLTTLILIATIMQVSASGYSQSISLNIKNAPLNSVIKEISRQSGYEFFYNSDLIEKTRPITINIKNSSLEEALAKCFINQPFTFEIQDKVVSLKLKTPSIIKKISGISSKLLTEIVVNGNINDEKGNPLAGATVRVKYTDNIVLTNEKGYFSLKNVADTATLVISYIGYRTKEVPAYQAGLIVISLELETSVLENVNVISTGYQTLPKERATGSFEKIDNQLFNRTTGPSVIARLNGTVPGIFFNKKSAGPVDISSLTIRGLSSLSGPTPLVILDNLPYEGDLNNLNPNDVESISILKDAAAASIWGARAGNGVIVITTKKGGLDKPVSISFNSNVTVTRKPDLSYIPQINSSDFIGVEKFLFSNDFYNSKLNRTSPYPPFITPVVELLAKQRALPITDIQGRAAIDAQIDTYKQYDIRNDYEKYIYRSQINQQYALNINGGGKQSSYYISGGYDKSLGNMVTSSNDRITLKTNYLLKPIKNLQVEAGVLFTSSRNSDIGLNSLVGYRQGFLSSPYPYARLVDDQGNPLEPGQVYRLSYLNSLDNNPKLLNWHYKPLEDINKSSFNAKLDDILLNLGANYTINSIFSADVKYQYELNYSNSETLYNYDSYYTRDLINSFVDPSTLTSAIPAGAIYNPTTGHSFSQTLRGQLNANKIWNNKHQFVGLVGAEIRRTTGFYNNEGFRYGYNPETRNFIPVDFTNTQLPQYYDGVLGIPNQESFDQSNSRFTSLFGNASYTYNNKYIISASARKDASNVFGVNSNRRGRPLWSVGAGWNISNESFYHSGVIPYLKLRSTYGTSGNTISSVPAFSVVTYGVDPVTLLKYTRGGNLPNPDLRWEKVGMLNFGIDFKLKNNWVSGSIEYYDKRSTDLIAEAPIDPTLSFSTQMYNAANLHGKGIDININSINYSNNGLQWISNFLFSYNRTKVTKYLLQQPGSIYYVGRSESINPLEGKDASAVFAYKWAGLDPQTGDPRGYLNGQVSKDYEAILGGSVADMQYIGPATPVYFGAFRNSFTYKNFTVSANILYKLHYYFNRTGINYSQLFSSNYGHTEFAHRWQKSGDENHTNVPSMIYPADPNRDTFYNLSSALVEKGDHIRLQDITAEYTFKKIKALSNCRIYGNISNLGIIWRANKQNIDPDILSGYRNPLTFSLGFNANF